MKTTAEQLYFLTQAQLAIESVLDSVEIVFSNGDLYNPAMLELNNSYNRMADAFDALRRASNEAPLLLRAPITY